VVPVGAPAVSSRSQLSTVLAAPTSITETELRFRFASRMPKPRKHHSFDAPRRQRATSVHVFRSIPRLRLPQSSRRADRAFLEHPPLSPRIRERDIVAGRFYDRLCALRVLGSSCRRTDTCDDLPTRLPARPSEVRSFRRSIRRDAHAAPAAPTIRHVMVAPSTTPANPHCTPAWTLSSQRDLQSFPEVPSLNLKTAPPRRRPLQITRVPSAKRRSPYNASRMSRAMRFPGGDVDT